MSEVAQRTPQQEVIAEIRGDAFKAELATILPEGMTSDRFARIAITALLDDQIRQPDPAKRLLSCERASLFQAIIRCGQDGLLPDGREAALVKRGTKVVYQPMIGGLRKIAAQFGWTIRSAAVREKDDFDFTEEPPSLYHKVFTSGERGELVYAYAVARHEDGRREQRVMTRDDVLKRAAVATTNKVWESWPDEMWSKTPARDIFGELPFAIAHQIARQLNDLAPGEAADVLYGSGLTEVSPEDVGERAEATPPSASHPAADTTTEEEPGLTETKPSTDVLVADEAAKYVPPTGKFSAKGEHGPKTLAEILALGEDGAGWVRWALAHVTSPPEYLQAVELFAKVYAQGLYQEAVTRGELG